jgi:hypothetical protein
MVIFLFCKLDRFKGKKINFLHLRNDLVFKRVSKFSHKSFIGLAPGTHLSQGDKIRVEFPNIALHSWVGSWPYLQRLDDAGKACQGQTL